jgi:hypothetical protein
MTGASHSHANDNKESCSGVSPKQAPVSWPIPGSRLSWGAFGLGAARSGERAGEFDWGCRIERFVEAQEQRDYFEKPAGPGADSLAARFGW